MALVQVDSRLLARGAEAGLRIALLFALKDAELLEMFASSIHLARHAVLVGAVPADCGARRQNQQPVP